MWSLSDKKKYHGRGFPKGKFSHGYIVGVQIYQSYGKGGASVNKRKRRELVDGIKTQAVKGDPYSKGFMCGFRDAANERKAQKKGKLPFNG